jgi:hypothetical protein
MNWFWIRSVALTTVVLVLCTTLPAFHGSYSHVSPDAARMVEEAPAVPQNFPITRRNADRSDVMSTDLSSVPPERPRAGEEPRLAEPPRLQPINPVLNPAPAAAANVTNSNPHFEQSSPGPDLQTETGPAYAGISHKETLLPGGLPPPNNKFIVRTAPPDTVGAVGEDHYVQWVNTAFAVFRKSTGELLYGPAQGLTLWKGFDNGPCEKANDGDPMVQYDKLQKRWIMSQFVYSKRPSPGVEIPVPPFYQCIAVSTTSNPLGKYRRYRFQYSQFNDFPKIGVWTDGYYVTFNMFEPNSGALVCAYDRDVMLGLPVQDSSGHPRTASQQCAQLNSNYWSVLPADIDGTIPPPPGTPNYLVNLDPNNKTLNFWRFKVDWLNEANSKLTGPLPVAGVENYKVPCLDAERLACIPQPATPQKLESLADRLMYRLAYRRFADGHESLLLNHTVAKEGDGGETAAIRWYELRDLATTPTVFQSGTFAPDGNQRWIGSMAMDKAGNIGLAYSVSSNSLAPSVYYTGHAASDTQKGRLGKEVEIVNGGGSQTCRLSNGQCNPDCLRADGSCISKIARWGDYSSLTIDPSDNCTMWFTTQFLKSTGGFNWSTIIYSFRFKGCTSQ